MSDWAASGYICAGPQTLLNTLAVLSLLYDSVLLQDEMLVLSTKLADWFWDPQSRRLLEELLDIGTIKVLILPPERYPTPELKEQAQFTPLQARAAYIQKYGSKEGKQFVPTLKQRAFHAMLDFALLKNAKENRPVEAIRPVGAKGEGNPTHAFGKVFTHILSEPVYHPWLRSAFHGFTDSLRKDFLNYVETPEKAVKHLRRLSNNPTILRGADGIPVFNRSLGYQLAATYDSDQARAMKHIIQTAFAAVFCANEKAAGRYSRTLRELVLAPEQPFGDEPVDRVAQVEAVTQIPLSFPPLSPGIGKVIADVRKTDAGQKLSEAVRQLGEDTNFETQTAAWRAVAHEFAKLVEHPRPITVHAVSAAVCEHLFGTALVTGLFDLAAFTRTGALLNLDLQHFGLYTGGEAAFSLAGRYILELLRAGLKQQKLRQSVEQSIAFRCVDVPLPVTL